MGRKSRKTRAKTTDFQKTKLKVGKKRPLPSNVTDVTFKSQAIYIAEQMKNVDIGKATTEAKNAGIKKNIPELLSQVGHFNKNFRVDSLTSLRISFTNNNELMRGYLPKVFAKVPHAIRDDDQQVRKSSVAFFKCVFSELTSQEMAPFFDAFLLHLYCAMTHIYDDVKKDSLQIFDLCIEHYPDLLTATSSDKLLKHFIDLISTKQTRSAAKEGQTDVTRVLSMKLSSKESSIVWRNRILERLYKLLNAHRESNSGKSVGHRWKQFVKEKCDGQSIECGSLEIDSILTTFESMKHFRRGFTLQSSLVDVNTQNEERLSPWELMTTLVPLLIDTWHEATSDESKQPSEDGITAMNTVLKITNVLLKRFVNSADDRIQAIGQIRDRHIGDFQKYFFDPFPINYIAEVRSLPSSKRRKIAKVNNENFSTAVKSINLSICEMITTLFPTELIGENAPLLSTVAQHLSAILAVGANDNESLRLDSGVLEQCVAVTEALLSVAMDEETTDSLLRSLLVLFHYSDVGSAEKVKLLNFFAALYSDFHFPRTPVMDEWICSLPVILAEVIHDKGKIKREQKDVGNLCSDKKALDVCLVTISAMRLALVKENHDFVTAFCEKIEFLLEIVKEESTILFCTFAYGVENTPKCRCCTDFQKRLFELFLHPMCDITIANTRLLTEICQMECIPAESVCYVAGVFFLRYERYRRNSTDFKDSMQFLSSILTGTTKAELTSLQSRESDNFEIVDVSSESLYLRHKVIVEKVCSCLRTIDHVQFVMRRFFKEKLLHSCRKFPAHSAFAIMKATVVLDLLNETTASRHELLGENAVAEYILEIGKFITAILMYCHGNKDTTKTIIFQSLCDITNVVMKRNSEALFVCIRGLGNTEYIAQCETTCRAIEYMASQSDLRENLNLCKTELNEILMKLKASHEKENANTLVDTTIFNLSAALSSGS